jgi:hypothetical protein
MQKRMSKATQHVARKRGSATAGMQRINNADEVLDVWIGQPARLLVKQIPFSSL